MRDTGSAKDSASGYAPGHSERELERLASSARAIDPITRQFFLKAGMVPGMRVLEVGSGAGDVAFLAAELVGTKGEIVGVDRAKAAIATARARAESRGLRQVSFHEGDPSQMKFDQPFDAVIGRKVLLFQEDPSAMVRKLATQLRPGGLIVFHETDWDSAASWPPVPDYDRCFQWFLDTLKWHGHETQMGKKLHSTFVAAGLPAPAMSVGALIGGGEKSVEVLRQTADLVETMIPAFERAGVATAADVGIETLMDRMLHDATAKQSVIVGRLEIGAWSRV